MGLNGEICTFDRLSFEDDHDPIESFQVTTEKVERYAGIKLWSGLEEVRWRWRSIILEICVRKVHNSF